jgi:probable rRNA maturation factor
VANIYFFNKESDVNPISNDEGRFKLWLNEVAKEEDALIKKINYIFCTDEELLSINVEYLKHDYYTDIITFPYCEELQALEADIFISVERVTENAMEFGVSFHQELCRVMVHGLLHLIGYEDKDVSKQKIMRQKENQYISLIPEPN